MGWPAGYARTSRILEQIQEGRSAVGSTIARRGLLNSCDPPLQKRRSILDGSIRVEVGGRTLETICRQ